MKRCASSPKTFFEVPDAIEFGNGVYLTSPVGHKEKSFPTTCKEKQSTTEIEGLTSAADFFFDRKANQLIIPDMLEGQPSLRAPGELGKELLYSDHV